MIKSYVSLIQVSILEQMITWTIISYPYVKYLYLATLLGRMLLLSSIELFEMFS